jgi:glycosyltransferase involved in cell wall biosynthesis
MTVANEEVALPSEPAVPATPDVSVVVTTFGRSGNLPRLVAALEAQTLPAERFDVTIVDNGSADDTPEVLERLAASTPIRLRTLRIEVNRGPAPARNLGWRSSTGRYVAFTDDDCVPRPTWLAQALAAADATPDLGVLQGATLRPRVTHRYTRNTVYRETLTPSPYFEGCNLVFPRPVLERTGGFDESFPFSGEDTAAGWAAIEGGGRWLFDECSAVEHDIVERPLRWHLMMAWREGNLIDVAVRHPSLRTHAFWRPWAHRAWNVAFLAGLVGTAAAVVTRRPSLLLTWAGWLHLRGLLRPRPQLAALLCRCALEDAVVCAGMVRGSLRNRTLVL